MTRIPRIAVMDTESTGVDTDKDRLVSFHCSILDEPFAVNRLVAVTEPIPAEATAVHNITTEQSQALGKPILEVLGGIHLALSVLADGGIPVAGSNLPFDLALLRSEARRAGLPRETLEDTLERLILLDALVLDRWLVTKRQGKGARKLVNLAKYYAVPFAEQDAHGAEADAVAAGRIVQKQLTDPRLANYTAADLHDRQIGWYVDQQLDFEHWLRNKENDPTIRLRKRWPL